MLRRKALGAVFVLAALATTGLGQAARPSAVADPMRSLPAGDLVLSANIDSLVNRTAPEWLSGSPAKLQEFNDWLAKVAATTNVEPRSVKSILLSATMPEAGTPDFVSVWSGSFDAAAMQKALSAKGIARSESHGGVTINVLPSSPSPLLMGRVGEVAVAVLDASTLLVGSVSGLRAAIDTRAGRLKGLASDAELIGIFEGTDRTADLRLALRMPTAQLQRDLERTPSDPTLKVLSKIRFVFGSINTAQGASVRLTARAESATDAKVLHDSVGGLLMMGRAMVSQNAKTARYAGLLESAAVTAQGADVTLALSVPTTVVQDAFKPAPPPAAVQAAVAPR